MRVLYQYQVNNRVDFKNYVQGDLIVIVLIC